MKAVKKKFVLILRRGGELFLVAFIISLVNLAFPNDPGFLSGPFNPYIIIALIVAAYYGKYYGFLSLFLSSFTILLILPAGLILLGSNFQWLDYWYKLFQLGAIPYSLSLAAVYIFGIIRDKHFSVIKRKEELETSVGRDRSVLLEGLISVNKELVQRVARQQDSISTLHSWFYRLHTYNLDVTLEIILDMTKKFSGATKASIWEYMRDKNELRMIKNLGWDEEELKNSVISSENTIEGWTVRNNIIFSVRHLLQFENLKQLDKGRNLLTIPIKVGRNIWGVLNIEDMPFIKYNLYTEKLLTILLSIVDPFLGKAIEFESIIRQADTNPHTGHPTFSHFFLYLENELKNAYTRNATLSVIILEIINFEEIVKSSSNEKAIVFIMNVIKKCIENNPGDVNIFHYKNDNQIVLLVPNLDYDGASLMCLEILEEINSNSWTIDDEEVLIEPVLGYATLGKEKQSAKELIEIAENLLNMQKL